jgi:biopolymer transport protein ExbB
MIHWFLKGGPIMWPLLLTSVVATSVVIERLLFIIRERRRRQPELVERVLASVERGDIDAAVSLGTGSRDFVVRTLIEGLRQRERSFSSALLRAAQHELQRFSQGLPILDTIVTLAPLLGLLGTVTGMIRAFGFIGGSELDTPAVITGGIAEALIATACGLGIAIVAVIPFNYLSARLEEARHEIEDASTQLELLLKEPKGSDADSFARR